MPDVSLIDARRILQEGRNKGLNCLACNRFTKVYKRKLNSSMAACLVEIFKINDGIAYTHINEIKLRSPIFMLRHNGGEFAVLAHFNLIETSPIDPNDMTKPTSGLWRITDLGKQFVRGEAAVPEAVFILNGMPIDFTKGLITVRAALGKKFSYRELMNCEIDSPKVDDLLLHAPNVSITEYAHLKGGNASLLDAQNYVLAGRTAGVVCPCCDRFIKVYPRTIISTFAYLLVEFSKINDGINFTHLNDIRKVNHEFAVNSNGGNFAKLALWDLVEEMPSEGADRKTSGRWRMTERGRDFVNGNITVPKTVFTLNREIVDVSTDRCSIEQCLGTRFDYAVMMAQSNSETFDSNTSVVRISAKAAVDQPTQTP